MMQLPYYGLRRSGYYAGQSEAGLASITALACEGVVWCRQWAAKVMDDGTIQDSPKVDKPPAPPFAWFGEYRYGGLHFMTESQQRAASN
jgi:hypothetical protein